VVTERIANGSDLVEAALVHEAVVRGFYGGELKILGLVA
jgi:hypothetical protein